MGERPDAEVPDGGGSCSIIFLIPSHLYQPRYDKDPIDFTLDLCFAGMLEPFSAKWLKDHRLQIIAEQKKGGIGEYQRHCIKICESVLAKTDSQ